MRIKTGNERVLHPHEAIKVVLDGTLSEPQLNHPEGICCDKEGYIWCGGERGEIYKIDPEQAQFEEVASTGGFALGLNFDAYGHLYICDSKHKAVFRYEAGTGEMKRLSDASGRMRFPNYPIYDKRRNVLYVSDSYDFRDRGPGIWRIDPDSGKTELWCDQAFDFANGLAISNDGNTLYLAESRGNRYVYRIEIDSFGNCSNVEPFVSLPATIPDGLALSSDDVLYMMCYEPSRIYCLDLKNPAAELEMLAEDPTAHELCHPTNGVIRGDALFVCNLGRWHISKIPLREKQRERGITDGDR